MKKTNGKKVAALAGVALVVGGGIGAAIAGSVVDDSDKVVELQNLIAEKEAALALEAEKVAELEARGPETVVEVRNVTNTVEVPVDNGNLKLVVEDYEGEELDEDEVQEIVDEVLFKNDVTVLAERLVEAEIVDFMDDEDMFGEDDLEDYRDDDVYSVSIDEDDTVVEDVDFDDEDATVYVEAKLKLENDDDKLRVRVKAEVEIRDGELEIVSAEVLE